MLRVISTLNDWPVDDVGVVGDVSKEIWFALNISSKKPPEHPYRTQHPVISGNHIEYDCSNKNMMDISFLRTALSFLFAVPKMNIRSSWRLDPG